MAHESSVAGYTKRIKVFTEKRYQEYGLLKRSGPFLIDFMPKLKKFMNTLWSVLCAEWSIQNYHLRTLFRLHLFGSMKKFSQTCKKASDWLVWKSVQCWCHAMDVTPLKVAHGSICASSHHVSSVKYSREYRCCWEYRYVHQCVGGNTNCFLIPLIQNKKNRLLKQQISHHHWAACFFQLT